MIELITYCKYCQKPFYFKGSIPKEVICLNCGNIHNGIELLNEAKNNTQNSEGHRK